MKPYYPGAPGHIFGRPRTPGSGSNLRENLLTLAVFGLCLLSGLAPIMMGGGDGASPEGGTVLRQGLYILVAGTVLACVGPFRRPRSLLAIPLGLCLALTWAAMSVTWAINPSTSVRRLILTFIVVWSICAGVRMLGYDKSVAAIRVALVGFLVANYVAVVVFPGQGIQMFGDALDPNLIGDWRGIMPQKNFAGPLCALAALAFLFDGKRVPAYIRWPIVLAALIFLYRSGSRTSLTGFAAAISGGMVYLLYSARYRGFVIPLLFLAILGIATYGILYVDPWYLIYGSSSVLSGRTEIWQIVWNYAIEHWMLGAGYGSFWGIGADSPVYEYAKGWVWRQYEGHNGFLDLFATLGLPGLVLTVLVTLIAPLWRLLLSREANGGHGALLVSLMLFAAAHNMGESTLFDRDTNSWMYLLFAIALTAVVTPDVGVRFSRVRPDDRLWRLDENDPRRPKDDRLPI